MKFIVNVCAAFLARVKPVSTMANPACMNITRKPVTRVHTKLMATVFAAAATLAAWVCAMRPSGHSSPSSATSRAERFMTAPGGRGGYGVGRSVHMTHEKVNIWHKIYCLVQLRDMVLAL